MTPDQKRALHESIAANKRHLQLLDSRIVELQNVREAQALERQAHAIERAGRQPYFYGAQSYDPTGVRQGLQNGIIVVDTPETTPFAPGKGAESTQRFRGSIQLDDDAPFVWTHILATMRIGFDTAAPEDEDFYTKENPAPMQSFRGPSRQGDLVPPPIEVGFTEVGSGRELFQAQEFVLGSNNPKQTGKLLPPAMFDARRNFTDEGRSTAGVSASAPGQGPSGAFPLPSQVVLPTSGAVAVSVRANGTWNVTTDGSVTGRFPLIVYITLVGYKLLEE